MSKIYIRLSGGLGNQMFQYAFGRRLSKEHSLELKLDKDRGFETDPYKQNYFLSELNIIENYANREETAGFKFGAENYIKDNSCFCFMPEMLKKPETETYYHGYWQNEKYFLPLRDILIREFSLKKSLTGKNLEISQLIKNYENSVCMHVRRLHGKNVYVKENVKGGEVHGLTSMQYYQRALEIIREKCGDDFHLFIFSDQPEWVKNEMNLDCVYTIINHNSVNEAVKDFFLMSLCKHFVIANSTMSWWAAWLGNKTGKTVIAPSEWMADQSMHTEGIIPERWIKI